MYNILNTWIYNLSMALKIDPYMVKSITVALIIFLGFWLVSGIVSGLTIKGIGRLTVWGRNPSGGKVLMSLDRPIRFLFLMAGLYLALRYLQMPYVVEQTLIKVFSTLVIIYLAWIMYNLAGTSSLFSEGLQEKLKIDNILLSFFSRLTRFLIAAVALVIIAQEWGYQLNGFIAGLGLGGLAVALAAKEALANIVGGIVLIMEKPFLIGDWISTPSGEGTVEDISFRSTKIRASNQAIITVPNSTLANKPITNHARMGKRKLEFQLKLGLQYQRAELESLLNSIRTILIEHTAVETDNVVVSLESIGKEELEVLVRCFVSNPGWEEFMQTREEINFSILDAIQAVNESKQACN